MPIPLAIMPPFMAYQSLVMGDAFGRAFQFGKRKISAMSNEDFNKMDIVTMFEQISNEYTRMIPTVEKAMNQSVDLQVAIVKELLRVLPALGEALLGEIGKFAGGENLSHLLHGHPLGHPKEVETTPIAPIIPPVSIPTPPKPPKDETGGIMSPEEFKEAQIQEIKRYHNELLDAFRMVRHWQNQLKSRPNDEELKKKLETSKRSVIRYERLHTQAELKFKAKYGYWHAHS